MGFTSFFFFEYKPQYNILKIFLEHTISLESKKQMSPILIVIFYSCHLERYLFDIISRIGYFITAGLIKKINVMERRVQSRPLVYASDNHIIITDGLNQLIRFN